MTDDPEVEFPLDWGKETMAKRKAWHAKNGKKRREVADYDRLDFREIVFPDQAGLRHAALVIAGAHANHPDAVAHTREILEALAIPTIMREGGDGRKIRKQRGKVFKDDIGDPMIGYGDD